MSVVALSSRQRRIHQGDVAHTMRISAKNSKVNQRMPGTGNASCTAWQNAT